MIPVFWDVTLPNCVSGCRRSRTSHIATQRRILQDRNFQAFVLFVKSFFSVLLNTSRIMEEMEQKQTPHFSEIPVVSGLKNADKCKSCSI